MLGAADRWLARLGDVSLQAGLELWQRGGVAHVVSTRLGIEGLAAGRRVEVAVNSEMGLISTRCTCSGGSSGCVHATALVHELAMTREPPAAAHAGDEPTLGSYLEALRWAAAHGMVPALIGTGCAQPPQARRRGDASRTLAVQARAPLELSQEQRLALRAALMLDAAMFALARREELPPRAPGSEAARPLWQVLAALRAKVRAHAPPLSRALRRAWPLVERTDGFEWTAPGKWFIGERGLASVRTTLRFEGETFSLGCTCRSPPCLHELALLDCALDALAEPTPSALAQQLLAEHGRPSWHRALELLVPAQASEPAKARPATEIWWCIERTLGAYRLGAQVRARDRLRDATIAELLRQPEHLAQQDLTIARLMAGAEPLQQQAFEAAVGHPRLLCPELGDQPVTLERVRLGLRATTRGSSLAVEPAVGGEPFDARLLAELLTLHPAPELLVTIDPRGGRVLLIDADAEVRRVLGVLSRYGDTFPESGQAALLERLGALSSAMPVTLSPDVMGQPIAAQPTTVLRLRLTPEAALELELLVRPGPGAPLYPPGAGPRDVLLPRGGMRGYVRRDLDTEPALARRALAGLPLALESWPEGPPGCFTVSELDEALALVAALESPPPGLEAEWLGPRPQVERRITASGLRVEVRRDRDWFDIIGGAAVEEGRLELAVLLDAARRQRRFVQVGPARWAELGEELRAHLRELAARTFAQPRGLALSASAAPILRELEQLGARIDATPLWERLRERLLRPAPEPAVPRGLRASLRDYQLEGYRWLGRLAGWGVGGCLADDMGLGKTVQAIALLLARAELGPALVVAPTSVCWNWAAEVARFAPRLRVVSYGERSTGAARQRALEKLGKRDLLVVSYGLLVRDAELLREPAFATIIFDEAQALKNADTQRTHAARALRGEVKIALSGTPFENHLGELWSLYSVVFPELFGSWGAFRDAFAGPIERLGDPDTRAALARILRPFLLRRTKSEVARELPPRTEVVEPVELSQEEHQLYEDARLAAVAELTPEGEDVRDTDQRFAVLAALTRLRLLACHPRLYDPTSQVPSAKLRRAVELLEELRAEGHRVLVFSQFTSHLALVREELAQRGFHILSLEGSTPPARRQALVQAFQEGEGELFLISLTAGGTGLNLTAADYVLHLDPWWNPAVEDQATDRAHRIGQERPVTVVRLVARGTIEEKILALHEDKRALVAGVLEGTGGAARLSTRELLALLAPAGSEAPAHEDASPPRPPRSKGAASARRRTT